MKALIAVDGSTGGFEAVRQAGSLLTADRDSVVLYYSPPVITAGDATGADVLERARGSLASVVFDEAKSHLPAELRVRVECSIGQQPPKQGIVAAAEAHGCTLIVVGARGLGPIERLLLGSVSSSVVRSAHVPVLVTRPRNPARQSQPFKVLMAVEAAKDDALLADAVKQFTWPSNTIGLTMSVVQSMFAGHVPGWLEDRARSEEVEAMAQAWVKEHDAEIAAKREELAAFDATLPDCFRRETPIVVEGHPADRILETIGQRHIDLAIVGARKPSAISRWLLGSTSETVLTHADCSVLVIRELGTG
jgi:nucleotide-binding universal stress UspA family protein